MDHPKPSLERIRGLARRPPSHPAGAATPRIAVIGAGFSGIGLGARLRQAGVDSFTIYDKAHGIGGTWRDNTYPGAACDIPSHLYSFSFFRRSDWTRFCSPQAEILEYLDQCCQHFGLHDHLCLGTEITAFEWVDEPGEWRLHFRNGEVATADIVVSALGQLNRPIAPELPGLEHFAGTVFHSARWDHDHDLAGERVAVIGNGASAVQFVPEIAERTTHLTVFQRSPYWMLPRRNTRYSHQSRRAFAVVPGLEPLYRASIYLRIEGLFAAFKRPGWVARRLTDLSRKFMESEIDDPELRRMLTPDFPLGCKRVLFSSDYYPTLARPDVDLVDSPITHVTPDAIVCADGTEVPVDTIILATGFAATSFLAPLEITGRGGRRLADTWVDGAEAHLGMAVSGFPNLFMLYGPNTNLGHNSILLMVERQVDYLVGLIGAMATTGVRWVDVRPEVMATYNKELADELSTTVWDAGCSSWYKTDSGRITTNWPGYTFEYWWRTAAVDLDEYQTADPVR
ncbi:MAG: NAD(P)/FAD-dependent oxidoreductase [Acidimicrobiia bacterium]|nr:NAD(P)/FAD-dependent oxidoreductase [Acidimicrobiia bacterium]